MGSLPVDLIVILTVTGPLSWIPFRIRAGFFLPLGAIRITSSVRVSVPLRTNHEPAVLAVFIFLSCCGAGAGRLAGLPSR